MTRRAASCALVALTAAGVLAASGHAAPPRPTPVVRSLEPAATAKLWRELVTRPRVVGRAQQACRPLRSVYYAQTDWLRLATTLAAQASPCAQYYVSVPPLVADKTTLRAGEAAKIRALGPGFHALAEIHYATWARWVASNGSTWFDAGVEARRRMAAAGFDVEKGDTWAVNEFSSATRVGTGAARQNARDLVRGLFTGDGGPTAKGVVFVIGVGQTVPDVTLYQTNVQNWMGDTAFWTDMSAYVSDWSQEVYPDYRAYAVPGAPIQTRRDYLNDYLQHELVLARAAPSTVEPARTYLQTASSPLASGAWQWASGYGWTMVPYDQMQAFVSAQVYALRSFDVSAGLPEDHFGFAWAPRNGTGLAAGDFAAQTRSLLGRLAAAIRDSGQQLDPGDPGSEACGPPGQNLYCGGDFPGAAFTEIWKSFRTWTQPVLTFTSAPQTLAAGAPSAPITLALLTAAGLPQTVSSPIVVTLTSASPRGQFSLAPTGPWTPTLALTIETGTNTTAPFFYMDTRAGSQTISAAASGVASATQAETILPGPPIALKVKATPSTVAAGETATLNAVGTDQFVNSVPVSTTWTVDPPSLGSIRPRVGATVTFTAGPRGGTGTVTASGSGLSANKTITVKPGPFRVVLVRYGVGAGKTLLVTVSLIDLRGRPVRDASVSVLVRRRGYRYFSATGTTAGNGRATFRMPHKPGCYRTTVVRAVADGYRWDRKTPAKRFCR
jgi:hypothetical protein